MKRRLTWAAISVLALLTALVAIFARPPAIPPEVRTLLGKTALRFRVSDYEGETHAWWAATSSREYDDLCAEAKRDLPKQGWHFHEGSHHVGEQVYEKDGWKLSISFWYKPVGSQETAKEPADIMLSRAPTLGDRFAATLQPLYEAQ